MMDSFSDACFGVTIVNIIVPTKIMNNAKIDDGKLNKIMENAIQTHNSIDSLSS